MRIEALYFAHLKEMLKKDREIFHLPEGSAVRDLTALVKQTHKRFDARSVKTAVNEEFAGPDTTLEEGDCVAYLPPVSGG